MLLIHNIGVSSWEGITNPWFSTSLCEFVKKKYEKIEFHLYFVIQVNFINNPIIQNWFSFQYFDANPISLFPENYLIMPSEFLRSFMYSTGDRFRRWITPSRPSLLQKKKKKSREYIIIYATYVMQSCSLNEVIGEIIYNIIFSNEKKCVLRPRLIERELPERKEKRRW